jgi:hypothetical protein
MLENEEYKGLWFLPQSEVHFGGTLTFGPDNPVRLNISGTIDQKISSIFNERNEFTIWGHLQSGEPITLFNCDQVQFTSPLIGLESATYNAQFIILGAHILEKDTSLINSVRVSYDHMEEWMGIYGHEIKEPYNMDSYEISFKKPEDIIFQLSENINGRITFWNNLPYLNEADVQLKQQNLIKLDFTVPISFTELIQIVWKFQRFLTLMTQQKVRIRWYYIYSSSIPSRNQSIDQSSTAKEIKVFYRQSDYKYDVDGRFHYLLNFSTFQSQFEQVLKLWFKADIDLNPIVDILYTNIGSTNEYIHNSFLNLVQAVEAYHRRKMQNTQELKTENVLLTERLLAHIPEGDDKDWLTQKLAYSYEPGLRKRLKELFDLNKSIIFTNSEGESKKISKLIEAIVNKRNYLTHYDESSASVNNDVLKMLKYTNVLRSLLVIIILRELGFDENFLDSNIRNKFRFHLN